jgi:hypothetical protein
MSNNTNPLLQSVKLPGRTFQLPSRGALYTDELDGTIKQGEIHVHPMTALTEINLKNPDMLFNGKALLAVVQECVPGIKKPLELFGRDVDAILFFLRLVTYGSEYRIEVKHDCEGAKNHSYAVDLEQIMMTMKQLDPTLVEAKRIVKLATGQIVYTRPMRFSDIIELFHRSEGKKELTAEDIKELAVTNLMCMIEKVDTVADPKFIEEWVRTLTTPQLNRITEAAGSLNDWGPDQIVTLKCKDCGGDMKVELPLNPVSFFTE